MLCYADGLEPSHCSADIPELEVVNPEVGQHVIACFGVFHVFNCCHSWQWLSFQRWRHVLTRSIVSHGPLFVQPLALLSSLALLFARARVRCGTLATVTSPSRSKVQSSHYSTTLPSSRCDTWLFLACRQRQGACGLAATVGFILAPTP